MKFLIWGIVLFSASWVSMLCLGVLLSRLEIPWLSLEGMPWGIALSEPVNFAAWIGLPTLACLGAQIWQVQRVGIEQ